MISIVHYSPLYETAHKTFAEQLWSKRKRTTPEYIYWKFRSQPGSETSSFILAVENEKVIGQLGLIPCSIRLEDTTIDAQWACDLMVDKTYRGKGAAGLLYEYALKLKPVTLGSDPSPAASTSMKRAGFISLKGPVKFLFPLYIGEITKLKGFSSKLLDKIPNPFILILSIWKLFRKNKQFLLVDKPENNEHLNGCPQKSKESISVVHDESFVNWRFKPFKDYYTGIEFYAGDNNSIYLVNKAKRLYLITHFFAEGIAAYLDIFSSIVIDALNNSVRSVKLMANTRHQARLLSILGFIKFRTPTEIIFYCADSNLKKSITNKYFHYTYMDSDENI